MTSLRCGMRTRPAQEASLRRTAQRNYHMKQKQARLEYRHSLRASKRDLAIAEQFPEQHPLSQRGGLLDGDSGSDSELLTEHGRIVPRDDDRRGAGIGSSDGRVGPYRTQQHPQTVFEGDSFVQSNQFVAGLAEAPYVAQLLWCAAHHRVGIDSFVCRDQAVALSSKAQPRHARHELTTHIAGSTTQGAAQSLLQGSQHPRVTVTVTVSEEAARVLRTHV